jgi:hypothetical protein
MDEVLLGEPEELLLVSDVFSNAALMSSTSNYIRGVAQRKSIRWHIT